MIEINGECDNAKEESCLPESHGRRDFVLDHREKLLVLVFPLPYPYPSPDFIVLKV